ncbi:hypothetical protein FRC00_001866 [Tulasnella sp. 408]|nr:hypothetical protein FRC00_001866 [Tulasnella sp. 408]
MHLPPASINTQQSTPPFTVAITTATTLVALSPEDCTHALRQQALTKIACPSVSMEDPVRHPQYYDAEGTDSVIFLTLKIMFSMLPGEGKRPDGETDNDPVMLPSSVVTVKRFELFLAWLYQDRKVPANLEEASTLLHLADYLDVPHLLKRMSTYVLALPPDSLPPAKRIYLHRHYHLSDKRWLHDAFSSILEGPFSKLMVTNLALLGIPTIHRLILIFAKLEKHHTTLAVKPPLAMHESDCKDYNKCEVLWLTFWATRISPLLLSEPSPTSGLKITHTLSTWAVSPWAMGMNYSCLWATANGHRCV